MNLVRCIIFILGVWMSMHAGAAVVTANFQGTGSGAYYYFNEYEGDREERLNGELITGRFRFDTGALLEEEPDMPGGRWRWLATGALELAVEFVLNGVHHSEVFDVTGDRAAFVVTPTDPAQRRVEFNSNFTEFGRVAFLHLVGDLWDGVDLASFHPGPVVLAESRMGFFSREVSVDVDLTEFSFGPLDVPEPGSLLLAATGLAALGGLRHIRHSRRRRGLYA